jgi:nucleoside phosphorylase
MPTYVPHHARDDKQGKTTFDVGVIIALPEELDYFLKYIEESSMWKDPPSVQQFWVDGHAFWSVHLHREVEERVQVVQVVVYLVAEMGSEFTVAATSLLIEKWHVPFVVNIGVTGSLDRDVKVGSVVIPTQITHYTANWKARGNEQSTEFIIGTRAFATNRAVVSQFSNFLATGDYREWQDLCSSDVSLPSSNHFGTPEIHLGHVASGNIVVDSKQYKKELKRTDRKLIACEMETAGFMIAEQFLQTSTRAVSSFIALRCISDMAAGKADAENGTHDVKVGDAAVNNRELAMRNATILFQHLIRKGVINADIDAQIALLTDMTKLLTTRKNETKTRFLRGSSAASLATCLLSKSDFNKLKKEEKIDFICRLDPNRTSTQLTTMKVGQLKEIFERLLLGIKNRLKSHSSSSAVIASRSTEKAATWKDDNDVESDIEMDAESVDLFNSESDDEPDDDTGTEVDDTKVDMPSGMKLSDLSPHVANLQKLISANESVTVSSTEYHAILRSLENLLHNVQAAVRTTTTFSSQREGSNMAQEAETQLMDLTATANDEERKSKKMRFGER